MATFLQLCQMVARESGVISGTLPVSVKNQTGKLLKIVHWTATAWRNIQNAHSAWRWLRHEFQSTATTAGAARYTAASWNLDRFAEWIIEPDTVTCYPVTDGPAEESPLLYMPWQLYRRTYARGAQVQNRPLHYSISPQNEFCLGPIPDGAYIIRGEYRKGPQELVENEDVPEMPNRFHDLIVWEALRLLAEHDEAELHVLTAERKAQHLWSALRRDQLPPIRIAGAIA